MRIRTVGLSVAFALCILTVPSITEAAGKLYRIGLVSFGHYDPARPIFASFCQTLSDLGYVEGRTLILEPRFAEGRPERLSALASELADLSVDVIVAWGTPAVLAAKRATNTIPIVIASSGDAVATGLVASLAHPGGNVTGLSWLSTELSGKYLELLREATPKASHILVLWDSASPNDVLQLREIRAAGSATGVQIQAAEVSSSKELQAAFEQTTRRRAGGVIVLPNAWNFFHRGSIAERVAEARLPAIYGIREYVEAGGLMSYGPRMTDLSRRAATFVDKILKGARPADLPMEQPTKFELVINLKTAKALGLTIPQSVLMRADEVIK